MKYHTDNHVKKWFYGSMPVRMNMSVRKGLNSSMSKKNTH